MLDSYPDPNSPSLQNLAKQILICLIKIWIMGYHGGQNKMKIILLLVQPSFQHLLTAPSRLGATLARLALRMEVALSREEVAEALGEAKQAAACKVAQSSVCCFFWCF